ncbi:MAG: Crp/Fnr family transcriptional regulator [Chloroflexota bacterium]|jgi:CRP/FNR family transcriptional regulator|nr:Crp/Fnr family transcriptional regulator [Chloroflexota bacterium]
MPIQLTEVRKIPALNSLNPDTCQALSQRLYQKAYREGQTLLVEGMRAEHCFFLFSGALRVLRMNREGRVQVLARLSPGAPVNILSLLTSEKVNRASVEAISDCVVFILNEADLDEILSHYPDFTEMLLRTFAERMALMTDLAAGLSLHTVRARLVKFLITLADDPNLTGGWTQDEIAAHIGTVRDVVGRLLREFESQGLIRREGQQIILLNRDGLSGFTE